MRRISICRNRILSLRGLCEEAKEGIISEPDEEALDPLVTDANTADLLWNNKTDDFAPDFAPISESVRKKILALKGVDQDRTECAEGAYMNVVISEKGWSPFSDEYFGSVQKAQMKEKRRPMQRDQIQKWKDPVSRRQYIF